MIRGLIVILLFQLLGEILVTLLHSPVPGPVIGMLLLWLGLAVVGGPSAPLSEMSQKLINHLALFFLPTAVGLFFLPEHLRQYIPALLAAVFGGTFVSMLFCGWLLQRLVRSEGR